MAVDERSVEAAVTEPEATRPYMPGYGLLAADAGGGLLSWPWAVQKLTTSRNYWLATVWPDARPHVMPVWAVWLHDTLFFSGSTPSRKMRNLRANAECVLTIEDAMEPVVVEGTTEFVTDLDVIGAFLAGMNSKYDTNHTIDFLDPSRNATVRVRMRSVFALRLPDFTGTPTRWTFEQGVPAGT
jgi:nitroimidazol reductase NimA-like FMN-containing flavoprotein (pyridoxamine 5'-phosphate oxidase superfamily)